MPSVKTNIDKKKTQMYAVVIGQCSDAMKAKLEANNKFETIKNNRDVIGLLNLIRTVAYD